MPKKEPALKFDNYTQYRVKKTSAVGEQWWGKTGLLYHQQAIGIFPIHIQFNDGTNLACQPSDIEEVASESVPEKQRVEPHEIQTIYNRPEDRFLVALVSSYGNSDDGVKTPQQAVKALLQLVSDESQGDTQWHVYDRKKKTMVWMEQSDADFLLQPCFV